MTSPLVSRRHLLGAGAALTGAAGVSLSPIATLPARAAEADFDELRARWSDYLTGGSELDTADPRIAARISELSEGAAEAVADAETAPGQQGDLWPDLPMDGPTEANIAATYTRILLIARAWATPGTDQYADQGLADHLATWYRHMGAYWYNETITKSGNWWFWEIGIPRILGDLSALADDLLTDEDRLAAVTAIRRFTPNPNLRGTGTSPEAGGNRADKVLACLLRGMIARDADDMALARDALSDVVGEGRNSLFAHVTSGNGFYADGSYIDHQKLPYVGTYGNVALSGVARSLMLVAGSPWQVTDPDVAVILDAPEDAFAPFIWHGRMMETVRGRAVSRESERDHHDGATTINALLLMATQIEEPYATTYRELAKGWLERCTEDRTRTAGLSDLSRILPVLADESVAARPEPRGHRRFGQQERMVHRGTGWAYTVATSSNRIGRYEWGNDENNLGWHQGDGAAYLHLADDQGQFADDYWPCVDPYRLPGTTASLTPRPSGASGAGTGIPAAANRWGGGVELAGRWGTAGMDLTNSLENLSAHKSWFLLDEAVICLGSGIEVIEDPAETIVENRSFEAGASPSLVLDGQAVETVTSGASPRWAHLDQVAGYLFWGESTVRAEVAERTGTWYDLNSGADTSGPKDERTRTFATLGIEHPVGASNATYGYVILPGATRARTETAAESYGLEILRQDRTAHVVRVVQDDHWVIFAHLFDATDEGPVRADGPCATAIAGHVRGAGRWSPRVEVALSSPTRSLDRVEVELDLDVTVRRVLDHHDRLTVTTTPTSTGSTIGLVADVSAGGGASFAAELTV